MITRDRLEREVTAGYKPIREVAATFGVSRSRIHALVKQHGIVRSVKPPRFFCPTCGLPKLPRRTKMGGKIGRWKTPLPGRHIACKPKPITPILDCSTCGRRIEAQNSAQRHHLRTRYRRNTSREFFCNRSCLGRFAGLYFGFGKGEHLYWPNLPDYNNLTPEAASLVQAIMSCTETIQDPHLRDEVCQEAGLLIVEEGFDVASLPERVPTIIKTVLRRYPQAYGPISLDAPPPWDASAPTLGEKLESKAEGNSTEALMVEIWS